MYYQICETLKQTSLEEILQGECCYVAVLSPAEWILNREKFKMGIDLDMDIEPPMMSKAEVNYDSLTGGFSIPDRMDIIENAHRFAFALDEKGIVFIDHDKYVVKLLKRISVTKKWKDPSLERFIYDVLEMIIHKDPVLLEQYEDEISSIEDLIRAGDIEDIDRIDEIRSELLKLRTHYEQLINIGQELSENENDFFDENKIRFFDMFTNRVTRLQNLVSSLRDYTAQVRELYQAELAVKQNRIMTILTVVTTIFMPLTLLVGWYGMNFKYMPELDSPIAYPIVIFISLAIIIGSLIYFKMKKWL